MCKVCVVLFCCFLLVGCCKEPVKVAGVQIDPTTFEVLLSNDVGFFLPEFLYFTDESPRTSWKRGSRPSMTIEKVVRTRYKQEEFKIKRVERISNGKYRVTLERK